MKRTVLKILVMTLITALQFTMMFLCGYVIGNTKGYKDGREAGRNEGKLMQLLEDYKGMLEECLKKPVKPKKEEQKETTEN